MALQAYQLWKPKTPALPFQLTLAIEPVTRANPVMRSDAQKTPERLFRSHLDEAIALYRQAMTHDAAETLTAVNIAQALIVRGIQSPSQGLSSDVVEAQAILLRAQQSGVHEQTIPQLLNTLGVASFYTERMPEAKRLFTHVRTLAPAEAAPVYNLSYLAQVSGQLTEAQMYQHVYQQLRQRGVNSKIRELPIEHVMGIAVGHFNHEVPSTWGKPTTSTFTLGETRWMLSRYPSGVMTLSQDDEILLLNLHRDFSGTSVQRIGIGSQSQTVLKRYGSPSRRLAMPRGHTWSYDHHRIAFHLRNEQVVGWFVY